MTSWNALYDYGRSVEGLADDEAEIYATATLASGLRLSREELELVRDLRTLRDRYGQRGVEIVFALTPEAHRAARRLRV